MSRLVSMTRVAAFLFSSVLCFSAFAASDVVTVGTVNATGVNVEVPISIRDVSGTTLGMDQPSGSRIQSISVKVTYAPASAVQSVSINRAGITAGLNPIFESKPSSSNSRSLIVTFQESSDLIPFTSNASAPGNLVARLSFTLSPSAVPGSSISLTLDPSLTQLTDAGGSAATKETVGNGRLSLVNGQINIPALSFALSPKSKEIEVGSQGTFTAILNAAAPTDTTITLASTNSAVATVPASIVISAGSTSASFKVTSVAIGTAKINAAMGALTDSVNVTVVAPQASCPKPAAPQLSAPTSALAGTSYSVTWPAVTNATDYVLEESTSESFEGATSQVIVGTSAQFTHDTAATRYYYRARARNRATGCDISSENSNVVSVLIDEIPVPETRVLAVVGSTPGNFGAFFRTSLQLYNPHEESISGKLVFHVANASGSASDPSLVFSIPPGRTLAYDDILPAMNLPSGLGTVDLIADANQPLPIALSRVFNDAGAAGTTGLTQPAFSPEEALRPGRKGVVLAPTDVTRFRLNIGVRTLEQGASLTINVRNKNGEIVKTATRTYGPTFFTQVASRQLLDDYVLTGGETITFEVTSGAAFVYGSTTDNTTNDPSVQFAMPVD
jgi:uncharacterized protein YjdB